MPMALLLASPFSRPISSSLVLLSKPFLHQALPSPLLLPVTPLPNLFKPGILTTRSLTLFLEPAAPPRAALANFSGDIEIDLEPLEKDDEGSPWEGAVVYRRDPSTTHLEYATTLERLGLAKLSSGLSRRTAADMGMRVVLPKRRKEGDRLEEETTPVLVSVDVTREKGKLQLDGIVRTVITLSCNRCAQPAAETVFSNFTLLLTEDPVEDSDESIMGAFYGDNEHSTADLDDEHEDESFLDLEDKMHFPPGKEEIDISKYIRDTVHVEITLNAICDAGCKGLCLECGTNLNKSSCNCSQMVKQDCGAFGPFKTLKKLVQKR